MHDWILVSELNKKNSNDVDTCRSPSPANNPFSVCVKLKRDIDKSTITFADI